MDFEALVDRDLRLVGLDLAEIRICGRIQHELVFHDGLCVQPDLPKGIALSELGMVQVAQVEVAEGAKNSIRDELKIVSGRNILQARGIAFLIQAARRCDSRYWGQNAPSLSRRMYRFNMMPQVCGSSEANRRLRKGMAILTTKPCGRELSLGAENGVERKIKLLAFGPESVGLNAQRIGKKSIGPAMIVERVQHHFDIVIVKHVFAARKTSTNLLGLIIEANEDDIQVLVVIAKVGLGALGGRLSVTGSALDKAVDLGQLAFPCRARASSAGSLPAGEDC